ncbi:MAG: alpha/beta hydrolase [Actinomycetota bacterium]
MGSLTDAEAAELFRRAPDRMVDADQGAVAVRTIGNGPDVVLVHGWPVSGATFRRVLPHLVDHVTCHVLDLPGAGQSEFDDRSQLSIDNHIDGVKRVIDALDVDSVAVVGHDSGGLIARHAVAGDDRLRGLGLINTEIPNGNGWRFSSFIRASRLPGFTRVLGWAAGRPAVRRNKFVLGDAFADRSLLDGEFDEFFLEPLHSDPRVRHATDRLIASFDFDQVRQLTGLHGRITAPVAMVWGAQDPFFPVANARKMVDEFADATLTELPDAGLFSHEEAPAAVADALLPALT